MADERRLVLGLDLGQMSDYSAMVAMAPAADRFVCNHIARWPLGTSYVSIVADVRQLIGDLLTGAPEPPTVELVVDATGVGTAVTDFFRNAKLPCPLVPVTITSGERATEVEGGWHVPKKDLAGVVAVLLQQGRLRIVRTLPLAATLVTELKGFKASIGPSGHVRFGNDVGGLDWRGAEHDDLVLALALAVWWASRPPRPMPVLAFGAARRPTGPSPRGHPAASRQPRRWSTKEDAVAHAVMIARGVGGDV